MTTDPKLIQVYYLDWQITIRVYATDANPEGKTAKDYTGTIYTYVVHDGTFARKSGSPGRDIGPNTTTPGSSKWAFYFVDRLQYDLKNTNDLLSVATQQPDVNTYDKVGTSYHCRRSFIGSIEYHSLTY